MAAINLGVDLGSTALRAAYSPPGEPVRVRTLAGPDWPWLRCEPATGGQLPVAFRSRKSRLGVVARPAGDGPEPEELVTRALGEVRRRITAETGLGVGETVISVPARFSSVQRTALLDAARGAGLDRVSLLTDSVAAVIGHTGGEGTGTYLVYAMGYDGFELGLVRAARGRYRALGYEGGSAPGGSTFDEQVLHAWLNLLRERGSLPDEVRRGDAGWRGLRDIAEEVKERFAAAEPVVFPRFVAGPGGEQSLTGQFDPRSFERLARLLVAGTLDRADALFAESGMSRADVDTVLLAGGTATMPQLRELVAGLGSEVVVTDSLNIARGAMLHAQHGARRSADHDEQLGSAQDERADPVPDAPRLAATLLTAPGSASLTGPGEVTTVDRARRLVREGRFAEAERDLRVLIDGAQELLDEIAASRSREPAAEQGDNGRAGSGDDLMAAARARFARGQYKEAISYAHLAWRREPNRPDLFEAMIGIHCDAAMANPSTATFAQDERWLRCALQHDQTNVDIRRLLAERIFLHGRELQRAGRDDEARRALQHALTWDPEHEGAEQLLHRLGGHR
ncbi:Hsp70 family protein [Saccharopolyspora taberi]|uniref:Hsp70 family protein n=1 Tax=Saccharopolyspora taberi TaxID=60895 RepID=A0ABN3VAA6_9PSEU